ncbi:MAG TPA: pantoate--beta-alanine ligase [Gemmataceae bacterium]|jgi:pantoate--beta-alanine ligase|nr:pantoate--beta-alanine ligase [Gemmataceae bacterium]
MMLPPVAETIADTRTAVAAARKAGKRIGFVPTMGALHSGHASLIRASRTECDFTVVSIFVNPTQFGPNEDYTRYPRTFDADRALCGAMGTDLIFAPTAAEMYPPESRTFVEVTKLPDMLCGQSRPGHFRGVTTVVLKLFHIVTPDIAYFGQKDAQQALIIRRMAVDLNLPLSVRVQPTVRETDGLAMSSRNRYLDPTQRMHAIALRRALNRVEELVGSGERSIGVLESTMTHIVATTPGASLDYARVLDAETLDTLTTLDRPALAALAVYFGTTRLIDNTILRP